MKNTTSITTDEQIIADTFNSFFSDKVTNLKSQIDSEYNSGRVMDGSDNHSKSFVACKKGNLAQRG